MNKAKVFLASFLLLICLLIKADESVASAIPSEDLFRSPDTYSIKFSPSTQYIAKHYIRDKKYYSIEINHVETNIKTETFQLPVRDYSYIKELYWVDENTLYVSYQSGENKNGRIFLDFNYDIFIRSNDKITTVRRIKSNEKIINPLIYENDKILVQREFDDQRAVYTITTEEFANDDFQNSEKFSNTLNNSRDYFSNNDGEIRIATTIRDGKLKVWYLKDKKSKWVELFELGEFNFEFRPIAMLNNNMMLVLTNRDTDKISLTEYNYTTKTFGNIIYQHDKYDLKNAVVDENTKELISVTYYNHGYLKTDYFPESNQAIDKLIKKRFKYKQYYVASKRKNSKKLILFVYSDVDPGSYYLFDPEESSFIDLGSSYSFLKGYEFSKTESFSVISENNVEIEAFLTKPNKSNGVLLVRPHGGPIGVRDINGFNVSNQFYASRGYSVLSVNFRGSAGYGKKFLREGKGQFGKNIEEDISIVVNNVRTKYDFDSTCAFGSSYGGYSAIFLLANNPEIYKCAVGAYGIYDLPLLFNASNTRMNKRHLKAVANTVGEYNENLKNYSPVYFAEKIQAPILLIAGADDPIASLEHSNRMKFRMKQLNKYVETLFYEKTGHGHKSLTWEKHEHVATEDFIRNQLKIDNRKLFSRKLLAKEAIILADSYKFSDRVKNDEKKAFKYYKIAAQNDHPRGIFNYADYFMRGVNVKKNVGKAIELYQKSSRLGLVSADLFLGEMYKDGLLVERDLDLSAKYYKKAKEKGSDKAELELELANCMGWTKDRNFDSCISYVDGLFGKNLSSSMDLLRNIIFNSQLNSVDINKVIKLINKYHLLDLKDGLEFQVEDVGLFGTSVASFVYRHKKTAKKLKITGFETIGINYELKSEKDGLDNRLRGLFKAIWHHPNIAGENRPEIITKTEILNWSALNRNNNLLYRFNDARKKVNGKWRLEIQSLSGETIFSEEWELTFD